MKVYQVVMPFKHHDSVGEYRSPLFKTHEDARRFLKKIIEMSKNNPRSERSWWTYDCYCTLVGPDKKARIIDYTIVDEWSGEIAKRHKYLTYLNWW
jgi:hypothetical protein